MIRRWLGLTMCLAMGAGAGAGYALAAREGMGWGLAVAMTAAALMWLVADSLYASRLLGWLRHEQDRDSGPASTVHAPRLPGLWGEAADRMRRLLKHKDQQLKESQARLDEFLLALQASPNGVVLLDPQGQIEWCNVMAAQHFGFDAERDVLQHIANLVREPAFKNYMSTANFSQDVTFQGNASTPSRPVKLSVQAYPYGKNSKLLLSRDITALEQAEAMRRDFVANVSHEVRTPLTVLTGFIETLQTLPLTEAERTRYLGLMAQQSLRMQTLVQDLLTLSRLEGSPLPGTADWVPARTFMLQCEQDARALSALLAPVAGHRLVFSDAPPVELGGTQAEIYSAMSNLVANAVRYTPAGGGVSVSWFILPDGRAEFQVKDTGPGIAPEFLPRVTERFYRIDRSRSRDTGGTGLGLAIVKHVAQRHGIELRIESKLGQGSCFSLVFPAPRIRQISVA